VSGGKNKMAKKKADQLLEIQGAALIMEQLYITGVYQDNKKAEAAIEAVKETLKTRLNDEEKRREFPHLRVVAKFQPDYRYETDYVGLNEYLYDLGLLVPLARIDYKELKKEQPDVLKKIEIFKNPTEQYVKMTPNKQGRVEIPEMTFSELSDDELILSWVESKGRLERTKAVIDQAREEMLVCPILRKEKKLSCNYGSVSILDKDPTYDIAQIYEFYGAEFLIQHSKPDMQKILMEFVPKGMLNMNDIQQFRTLKSISSKFILMDLETESRQYHMFWDKRMQAANNLRQQKELERELMNQHII
jgi:hypothetical protein